MQMLENGAIIKDTMIENKMEMKKLIIDFNNNTSRLCGKFLPTFKANILLNDGSMRRLMFSEDFIKFSTGGVYQMKKSIDEIKK